MKKEPFRKYVDFRTTTSDFLKLKAIAESKGKTISEALRELVREAAYRHEISPAIEKTNPVNGHLD